MTIHRKHTVTLKSLSIRQWAILIASVISAIALVVLVVVSRNFYESSAPQATPVTSYSATENLTTVSRGAVRDVLNSNTSYITVVINGHHRTILGTNFTDVRSVLNAGDITLEPHDVVTPSLDTKVKESTVITIQREGAKLETSDDDIAFNVVKKETAALPKGTEKVQQNGVNGVMETAKLVTHVGKKVVSSNIFASYVKKAPKDKIILVGTGGELAGSPADISLGTTVPAGEMQNWAHDWLLSNGYSEADFTATVFIISHESGWRVNAMNPSGAYGLPQALPGGKMASAGADWATNYQTQLKWFWNYCNRRYGSIQGAYQYWMVHHNY